MILNKSFLALGISRILVCCTIAVSLTGCAAQGNRLSAPANHEPGPIDPDELEAFTDHFFSEQMDELHIPGLIFVCVQDGRVLLAKGYGNADLEQGIPFDPDETAVRIGSVSKLFVATAVMQLVESGELDLHTDYKTDYSPFDILVTKSNNHILVDDVEYGEIAPLLFQQVDGADMIAFREDDEGDITYMFMFSSEVFEKLDQ